MKIPHILLFLLTPLFLFSQTWKYSSGGNSFDGKYRTSHVVGTGDEFPYNKPVLALNQFENDNSINFYISKAGYYPEDTGIGIYFAFNNEPDVIYTSYDHSHSSDGEILFLNRFSVKNGEKISRIEFIQKLKSASKLDVRVKNEYGLNNMVFSLNGSTKAINYVISLTDQKELLSQVDEAKREGVKGKKRIDEILSNQGLSENDSSKVSQEINDWKDYYKYNLIDIDTIKYEAFYDYGYKVIILDSIGNTIQELVSTLELEATNLDPKH